MGEVIVVACITSDGGLDNNSNYIIPKKDYFEWLREVLDRLDGVRVVGNNTYKEGYYGDLLKEDIVVLSDDGVTLEQLKEVGDMGKVILGGKEVYEEFIGIASKVILLEISCVISSNKYFPEFDVKDFKVEDIKDIEKRSFYGVEKVYKRIWEGEETNID